MNEYSSRIKAIVDGGVGRTYDDIFMECMQVLVDLEVTMADRIYQMDCKLHPLLPVPPITDEAIAQQLGNVPVLQETTPPKMSSIVRAAKAATAKAQGFDGAMCDTCFNFTLKRTGTCMTCSTCGANSGCS